MSFLSAASMESYARAYPFLTRLHILQEIETGSHLVSLSGAQGSLHIRRKSKGGVTHTQMQTQTQGQSSSQSVTVTGSKGYPLFGLEEQEDEAERNKVYQELHWDQRLDLMSPSFRERSACLAVRRCILGDCSYRTKQIFYIDFFSTLISSAGLFFVSLTTVFPLLIPLIIPF